MKLSHLDAEGRARMVDVGDKAVSDRHAVARGVRQDRTAPRCQPQDFPPRDAIPAAKKDTVTDGCHIESGNFCQAAPSLHHPTDAMY